jgi:hypothetical protein
MQSFHDEDPAEPAPNGQDPKLKVQPGTRGNLGQED